MHKAAGRQLFSPVTNVRAPAAERRNPRPHPSGLRSTLIMQTFPARFALCKDLFEMMLLGPVHPDEVMLFVGSQQRIGEEPKQALWEHLSARFARVVSRVPRLRAAAVCPSAPRRPLSLLWRRPPPVRSPTVRPNPCRSIAHQSQPRPPSPRMQTYARTRTCAQTHKRACACPTTRSRHKQPHARRRSSWRTRT